MSISDSGVIVQNRAESSLVVEVKEKQDSDPILLEFKGADHKSGGFLRMGRWCTYYQDRLSVPDVGELRKHILAEVHGYAEVHKSRYSIHQGLT